MGGRLPTRQDDELHLRAVRMRSIGVSAATTARRLGLESARARVITNRIKQADIKESGEPQDVVRSAYWGDAA